LLGKKGYVVVVVVDFIKHSCRENRIKF